MDIRRNIDSKSYMDLRGYFFYFLRLATSLYSLMLLRDIRRNIDSKSYMDLRGYFLLFPLNSYFPIFPYASNGYKKEYRQHVLYGSQEIPSCKFKGRSL